MAAPQIAAPPLLTYEEYLASEETSMQRYDIIDGELIVNSPTELHQDIVLNIAEAFRGYQRASGAGKTLVAPRDVLISQVPLRTRQPDVMFISHERHTNNPPRSRKLPMYYAPELAVEVLSDSDTKRLFAGKLADYQRVDVRECWVIRPEDETVEVLQLTPDDVQSVAVYGPDDTAHSFTFPGLSVAVRDVFAA